MKDMSRCMQVLATGASGASSIGNECALPMEQCMRQVWAHLDRALLEGKQENPRWSVASCFGTIDPTQYMMSVLGLGQELKLRGCQVHGRLEMSSMPCPLIAKRVRYHAGSPSSKVTFQSVFAAGTSKCDALVGSFGDHDMAALAALGSSEFCPDFLLLDLNLSPKKGRDFEEIFRSNFPGYKQVFLVLKKYSAPESKVHASDERTLFAASCRSVPDLPEPLELAWTKGIRVLNDVLAPKVPSLLQCLLDQKSATWKYEMEAMRQHTGGKRKRDVENEKASSAQDHGDDNGRCPAKERSVAFLCSLFEVAFWCLKCLLPTREVYLVQGPTGARIRVLMRAPWACIHNCQCRAKNALKFLSLVRALPRIISVKDFFEPRTKSLADGLQAQVASLRAS